MGKVDCLSVRFTLVMLTFLLTIFSFLSLGMLDGAFAQMGQMWAECGKHKACLVKVYFTLFISLSVFTE